LEGCIALYIVCFLIPGRRLAFKVVLAYLFVGGWMSLVSDGLE
jgi:hypothetical protein